MRVTLDTHILVYWCSAPERLSAAQKHALQTVHPDNPAVVADISLWEIAVLVTSRRLSLDFPLREWLNRALAPPLVRVAEITSTIADEVARLDNWENRDPADRLIVATARVFGGSLLTNDARIREADLVPVV
jgi:PIN domain nuclease of toxin-antitoxin system